MTRTPLVVVTSLSAISITSLIFASTTAIGGAPAAGALFLLPVVAAFAVLRRARFARVALFVTTTGAMLPLGAGIVLTWPTLHSLAPYATGVVILSAALIAMVSRTARRWFDAPRADG